MKIRRCPGCAQLVHFEAVDPVQLCWNCGRVTDFSTVKAPEERLGLWLLSQVESAIEGLLFSWPTRIPVGKLAFLAAMPVAILMLLICNSFDVRLVHDLTASFGSR